MWINSHRPKGKKAKKAHHARGHHARKAHKPKSHVAKSARASAMPKLRVRRF